MEKMIYVLYAEDDLTCAAVTKQILEQADFNVKTVPDGDAAWHAYRVRKPDLFMLDLEMPGKSGIDLIRLVREGDAYTPIILYSNHASPRNEIAAFSLGANDFISKSCCPEVLVSRLKSIYNRSCQVLGSPHVYILSPRTTFNSVSQALTIDGIIFPMRPKDARFLHLLCAKANDFAGIQYLLEGMWGGATTNKKTELKKYASRVRMYLSADTSLQVKYILDPEPGGYSLIQSV